MPSALEQRAKQSIILSRMVLACCRALSEAYHRDGKSIDAVWGEILIGMAVLARSRRHEVASISTLVRLTGMPRSNVRRAAAILAKQNVLRRIKGGYVFHEDYFAAHPSTRPTMRIRAAVLAAAKELQKINMAILAMAILAS